MSDVAYWPSTFLAELEGTVPGAWPVLWSLGGPSFLYRTAETSVWIDPYFGGTPDDAVEGAYRATAIPVDPERVSKADVVISTHDHVDHCHEGTVMPIVRNTSVRCVAPASSARLMRSWGVPDDRLLEVAAGTTLRLGDVEIAVYPSYDPGEPEAATYVLSACGVTLFVSGDTWRGPALAEVGTERALDYALLAFGRTWYMNEEDFMEAADDLSPGTLLPFHWEFWRNHTGDVARLLDVYRSRSRPFQLKLLLVGDSLQLVPRSRTA